MQFKSITELQEFCQYIERDTRLFELDILGYPWYYVVKQSLWNSIPDRIKSRPSEADKCLRLSDFITKLQLLDQPVEYAFYVKAKMRRSDPEQVENLLFQDIFDYLSSEDRRFIIFEEPSGVEYDTKYLRSRFGEVTIPAEYLFQTYKSIIQPLADEFKHQYIAAVELMFTRHNPQHSLARQIELLKQTYLQRSWQVPHILMMKMLSGRLGVKALIGGMGSHLSAGLDNRFAVVEVGHGYPGANRVITQDSPVCEYLRDHFDLENFYTLAPSPTDEIKEGELCCLTENIFNYGMPEVRAYRPSDDKLSRLQRKYDLSNHQAVLLTTSGWIDYAAFKELLKLLHSRLPQLKVLLRPHPAYDHDYRNVIKEGGSYLHPVGGENLFDLFSVVNVVVSAPSSVAVEASQFTENIVVFTDNNYESPCHSERSEESYDGLQRLSREYPFAKAISLRDTDRIVEQICQFLGNPGGKNHYQHPVAVERELERLFEKIEGRSLLDDLQCPVKVLSIGLNLDRVFSR